MAGLTLYTSNRLEALAAELARVLVRPLPSPLEPELIVVQSRGMERWIAMELARHHGICANCRFPFPNAFVEDLFRRFSPGIPDRTPFDPEIMTWKLMDLLPTCLERPGFESLRAYLGDGPEGLKRYQLCRRISDAFDQYLLFRPSMIFRWEAGKERHWQAQLWREVVRSLGGGHRAALGKDLVEALKKPSDAAAMLPPRISVFGISALPRFHTELLAAAAQFAEVNLFLLNPCAEYWGDIVSEWEAKRVVAKEEGRENAFRDLHLEKGNSLLASMGALGRDFFDLLGEFPCREQPGFEEPEKDGLLFLIQSDILHLRERLRTDPGGDRIRENDTSIQVHCCHSPMREMEVLRDRLLRMFEEIPGLMPGDVLVMAPDIEAYSPYIQAVFDIPQEDRRRIPFSIADRSMRRESALINVFMAVLDLPEGRFEAPEIMGILESRLVRRKFGMEEADLETVRKWLRETRIRWGFDESSRTRIGLPPFPQNTWQAGLERLLLGYALPADGGRMFGGVLPCDLVEGENAGLLGKVARFVQELASLVEGLDVPRTLDSWAEYLLRLIERLCAPDPEAEREARQLRRLLEDLRSAGSIAGFEDKVDARLIRWHLKRGLQEKGFGFGFLTGAVTFCAMLPMRSIPFKVICLVGMNHDAYPRQSRPVGFDLMARHPMPGDRSRRNDDRYLFLEALLSARERLYISYVGRSVQDNAPIPPSVLVSELLDYISQGFCLPEKTVRDFIIVHHPLQAFSPAYFNGRRRLFSYSDENCEAARRLLEPRREPVPFLSQGLPPPGDEWNSVPLEDLCAFFGNPARYLLNSRLRIRFDEAETVLEDREAFDVQGLDKFQIENDLLQKRMKGFDPADLYALENAAGRLPYGALGQCVYKKLIRGVERFYENLQRCLRIPALDPLPVDLAIGEFRITGQLRGIHPAMRLHYRYGRIRPKDRLDAWIRHLVLNCLAPEGYPRVSLLAGPAPDTEDDDWLAEEFGPAFESRDILEDLLKIYRKGLIRPLHFFPESSWIYIRRIQSETGLVENALRQARAEWAGSEYKRGERQDPYFQLCFGDMDPVDGEFQEISEAVFEPLLRHQREVRECESS